MGEWEVKAFETLVERASLAKDSITRIETQLATLLQTLESEQEVRKETLRLVLTAALREVRSGGAAVGFVHEMKTWFDELARDEDDENG